jgi:hypothetical protein
MLALRLQSFATAIIPSLLNLQELLDNPRKSESTCFMKHPIGNAAKQLGLDFVAERRLELESLQDYLLELKNGTI